MRFDRDTEMAKALRVDHRPALDETIDPTHPVIASPRVGAMRRPRTGSAKQSRARMDGHDGRNGRNASIAIVCHINPDLSIWNADFKPRECRQG
jgi:hypothetical protein